MLIDSPLSQGDTFLHRLDPRVKVVVTFCFSVLVAVGRRLIPVNGFLAMLWAVLPFS